MNHRLQLKFSTKFFAKMIVIAIFPANLVGIPLDFQFPPRCRMLYSQIEQIAELVESDQSAAFISRLIILLFYPIKTIHSRIYSELRTDVVYKTKKKTKRDRNKMMLQGAFYNRFDPTDLFTRGMHFDINYII